jgi:ubiquinone/menaquinone biosynthesis C-methylase UbiE
LRKNEVQHKWSRFNQERKKWQDPSAVLAEIGLKPGDTFLDIGCGDGFFALPAAGIVGQRGTVYGLDINKEAIESLKQGAADQGLVNLKLKVGRAEDELLCEACGDIVFFGTVLHDFQDPARVLLNARKMIKPKGKLANLDWKKEPTPFGPPESIRFNQVTASQMIEAAGFRVLTVKDCDPYHYLIQAKPA